MHIDRRTVSRKTPRDGKLEISPAAAARLEAAAASTLSADWLGATAPAALVSMTCTCGAGDGTHEHRFLQSEVFRSLPVGQQVDLTLDSDTVRVAVTPSS